MVKIIRLDKSSYGGKKYNNAREIDNAVALAKGMSAFNHPRRKRFRNHIIEKCKKISNLQYNVSHKDIKRLECAQKCELPITVVDILEVLVNEITNVKGKMNYIANDNYIISAHILNQTLDFLKSFFLGFTSTSISNRSENKKYITELNYVKNRFDEFNKLHPGTFNSLLQ